MNSKYFLLPVVAFLAIIVSGCGPTITNLTSERQPQNVSGIYTLSMAVTNDDGNVIEESFAPHVVVDGSKRPMRPSNVGKNVFEYDYAMPEGRNAARYYYLLDYDVNYSGSRGLRQISSDIYNLRLTNRYVITMESQRGPVGSEIPVVGRGFTEYDKIVVGGIDAETRYASPQAMTFVVPALPANEAYPVELVSGYGTVSIGYFQVDPSRLKVHPESLDLRASERTVLIFGIDYAAPAGGLPIAVSTDIPESVIMPEVVVPAGATTVSVPVEGGAAGKGVLVASASGFQDRTIALSVSGSLPPAPASAPTVRPESSFNAAPAVGEGDDVFIEETILIEVVD